MTEMTGGINKYCYQNHEYIKDNDDVYKVYINLVLFSPFTVNDAFKAEHHLIFMTVYHNMLPLSGGSLFHSSPMPHIFSIGPSFSSSIV